MTNTRYNKCKNPDKSELLTKDLKVATDCTVSGVIFSEFQGAMSRSRKKMFAYVGVIMSGVQFPLVSPDFYIMGDSEHFRVVRSDPTKQDLVHVY